MVKHWNDKVRIAVGNISLELPVCLLDRRATLTSSAASVFVGNGLTVIVDQGPFADRLDGYAKHSGFREETGEVGGASGRTIACRSHDRGMYTVATHIPAPNHVTVVVQANALVPEPVPRKIIDSLLLLGSSSSRCAEAGG